MTSDAKDPRFAPPQAHVEDVQAPTADLQLATRTSRLGAALLDLLIALVLLWLASVFTPWNPWGTPGASVWAPQWSVLGGLLVFIAVHGWLLHRRGQTVGKALLGIRIIRTDGAPASLARLLGLRYGIGWVLTVIPALGQIWGLVDALLIFRASRRCLHDAIADTIVVKA